MLSVLATDGGAVRLMKAGRSMHLTSVEHGVIGLLRIVGAHLPIAAGAACRRSIAAKQVAVRFSATAPPISAFHEALNLARCGSCRYSSCAKNLH